jgi:hypothetical protein
VDVKLAGSGTELRIGYLDGTTLGKCSDYEGSCSSPGTPDAVYWFKSDIAGMMSIGAGSDGTYWAPIAYARTSCEDASTELICALTPPSTPIPIQANTVYYVILEGPISTTLGNHSIGIKVIPK